MEVLLFWFWTKIFFSIWKITPSWKTFITEKHMYMYIFYIHVYTRIYVNTFNLIIIIDKIMFGYKCFVCYPSLEQKNNDEYIK